MKYRITEFADGTTMLQRRIWRGWQKRYRGLDEGLWWGYSDLAYTNDWRYESADELASTPVRVKVIEV